jgi:tetrahydromethanopterin S-methyltransferase subunit A
MLKVKPHADYPTEEGRYLRGNDFSPVAVAIILNQDDDKIPPDIQELVRAGWESGAALAGTIQTPNIGFEKMISNLVANPNVRYLILGGPESAGHLTGEALKALFLNGVNAKKGIVGTEASHASLFNLPNESIERFRKQISLIDLQFEGDPEVIKKAVWSCYQENRVPFRGYTLSDPGAFPEPPLGDRITWRVNQPWAHPVDDGELEAKRKAEELMARLRTQNRTKSGT